MPKNGQYTLKALRYSHESYFLVRGSLLLLLETSLAVNVPLITQSVKIMLGPQDFKENYDTISILSVVCKFFEKSLEKISVFVDQFYQTFSAVLEKVFFAILEK